MKGKGAKYAMIALCICNLANSVRAFGTGAPCAVQYTMKPSVAFHGPPQNVQLNPPPYKFNFLDSNGQPTNEYTDGVHMVRLSGVVPFRGFLIQARLATKQAFLIGHLRGGRFLQDEKWAEQGVQIQNCQPPLNDSVTHGHNNDKYSVEVKWQTRRNDGPIQFVVTVVQTRDTYWHQWQPLSGFILPSQNSSFSSKFDSPAKSISNKPAESAPRFAILSGGGKFSIRSQVAESESPSENANDNEENPNQAGQLQPSEILTTEEPSDASTKEPTPCELNHCYNNGTCIEIAPENRTECQCTQAWRGSSCTIPNYCYQVQCQNNATCVNDDLHYTYSCDCVGEWAGKNCDRPCPYDFCKNGAKCQVSDAGNYSCSCVLGFVGERCEKNVNECIGVTCQNNGTCVDQVNGYECKCSPGFMGRHCHRPCRDIYQSCRLWRDQERCELLRNTTDFFDLNCASSCELCVYANETVTAEVPLPPFLEPLQWLLGKYAINTTSPLHFPLDFDKDIHGYHEEIEITPAPANMFGAPSLSYSAKARNLKNSKDRHMNIGFLTLANVGGDIKVSLMTTSNEGMIIMEEGILNGLQIDMEVVDMTLLNDLNLSVPSKIKRSLSVYGEYLVQTVERYDDKGKKDTYIKYYYREKRYYH